MTKHLMFDSATKLCKVYEFGSHKLLFECEMRDRAVHGPGFGRWGRCPRGTYTLGLPVAVDEVAMGVTFIPVLNVPGRGGIGIHGGGTGLPFPFSAKQGWVETLGCLRVQNDDLEHLRSLITEHGCVITVTGL